jgi:hypothetical protein
LTAGGFPVATPPRVAGHPGTQAARIDTGTPRLKASHRGLIQRLQPCRDDSDPGPLVRAVSPQTA